VGYEGIQATPGKELLVAETPVEFADQIARLDTDPALRQSMIETGRQLAEDKYGWNALRRRLAGLHQEALKEHRDHRASARA
jgi:polysaccharide biosynthesis protein PslH